MARTNMQMEQMKPRNTKPNTKLRFGAMDIPLLSIVIILLLFGLVMLFSASYPSGYLHRGDSFTFIKDQISYAVLGVGAMLFASLVDYRLLKKFAWPLMIFAIALLVIVLFMEEKNNASRWIWLNSSKTQGFQPSEISKFAIILAFSSIIAANQKRIKTFKYGFLPFMILLGITSILLIAEPHLSCTILIIGIGVSMMFAGGTSIKYFLLAGGIAILAVYLALTQFPEQLGYAMDRIQTWQNPFEADPSDSYQTIQSLIAIGSGGINGVGIGKSVQKFLYLPEVYNDYIFAIVCEELGMIGAMVVIILFLLLLGRCVYIAMKAKDKFASMLVIGVAVQVTLQALLHIAVNLNAIPATGISLPFFSYGGTSLVMILGQMGVVMSVARRVNLESRKQAQMEAEAEAEKQEQTPIWEAV